MGTPEGFAIDLTMELGASSGDGESRPVVQTYMASIDLPSVAVTGPMSGATAPS